MLLLVPCHSYVFGVSFHLTMGHVKEEGGRKCLVAEATLQKFTPLFSFGLC